MKIKFIPVLSYHKNELQSKDNFQAYIQKNIEAMKDGLDLSEIIENIPQAIEKDEIILLFTNNFKQIRRAIGNKPRISSRVMLMGYPTEDNFMRYLSETRVAGLITSSALDKWYRAKIRPQHQPILRSVVDYGLFGHKEAFTPDLFSKEEFDVYHQLDYGFFYPPSPEDYLHLEDNLHRYVHRWLDIEAK